MRKFTKEVLINLKRLVLAVEKFHAFQDLEEPVCSGICPHCGSGIEDAIPYNEAMKTLLEEYRECESFLKASEVDFDNLVILMKTEEVWHTLGF